MEVVVLLLPPPPPPTPSSPDSGRTKETALLTSPISSHPRIVNTTPTRQTSSPSSSSPTITSSASSLSGSALSKIKTKTKTKNRSVTIELTKNETHVLDENLCSCADDIWYPADHFAEMKAAGKRDAREGRRLGMGVLLSDTFATPGPHAQDAIAAFCRLDGGLPENDRGDDRDILHVSRVLYNTSRRGLERSLSRRHGDERSEMKDRARRAVLIHQTSLTRQGAKPSEISEKIATVYRKHCRSARLFARRFGIADELAVAFDDNPHCSTFQHAEARQVLEAALGGDKNTSSSYNNNMYNKLQSFELLGDTSKGGGVMAGGGRAATAQRRFSNASLASSTHSVNSYDSNRRFCGGGDRSRTLPRRTSSRTTTCPSVESSSSSSSSPPPSTSHSVATAAAAPPPVLRPSDELYVAAIA